MTGRSTSRCGITTSEIWFRKVPFVYTVRYVLTEEQIVDIFTKPLIGVKFVYFRDKLGMAENASLVEREC